MLVEELPSTRPKRQLPRVKVAGVLEDRSSSFDDDQCGGLYIVVSVVFFDGTSLLRNKSWLWSSTVVN